ncbi:flagellar protein FlaG [Photobacterium rosenbergii]|uniref:flagellar protein FlaG n=1 Tax=Photobacterium rosenbergii TaxID=294936 RepID=UPI001C9A1540|nr:flagellar protein FlaG [Photobacterium rosenbergii]MBY5947326.1 flagellar protein FlaG [Photobacterium rosenbergii]
MEIPPDNMRPLPVTSNNPSDTSSPSRDGRSANAVQKTNQTDQSGQPLVGDKASNSPNDTPKHQLDEAMAEKMAMYFQNVNRELKFQVDNEGGDPIVIIIDKASGDVIRQVPAQELLDINESLAKYPPVSLSQKV